MGGEPLCAENLFLTNLIITSAREEIPGLKVYVWTGYLYKDLKKKDVEFLKSIPELHINIMNQKLIL